MIKISRRSFLMSPVFLAACKFGGAELHELSGMTMGTSYKVVAVDHNRAVGQAELQRSIDSALAEVNAQMSNWDPQSEISRFNARSSSVPMPVSAALTEVMQAAQEVHKVSGGQFDVTVGPLIDAWGFGAREGNAHEPSDEIIAAAMEKSGQSKVVRVGNGSLQKNEPGAEIYLSAIGKGYGVDRVAQAVEKYGIRDYMVEIGGDLYTSGRNPDGNAWRIGVETPDMHGRSALDVVGITDVGMATSGDYRNYFDKDGKRFSHLIDPTTGRPVTHTTTSATVLADNAMLADAWATAMLVLGKERGLEIAEKQNLAVLFVERGDNGVDAPYVLSPSARFTDFKT